MSSRATPFERGTRWFRPALVASVIGSSGLCGGGLSSGSAQAQTVLPRSGTLAEALHAPGASAAPIALSLQPVLGEGSSQSSGWSAFTVQVSNRSHLGRELNISLLPGALLQQGVTGAPLGTASSQQRLFVPAGAKASLQLWTLGGASGPIDAVALDAQNTVLGRGQGFVTEPGAPLLVEVTRDGSLARRLHGQRLPEWLTERGVDIGGLLGLQAPAPITVRAEPASLDPETGRPNLPDRAAGYSAATLLLIDSSRLLELPPERYQALADWLLSGGVVALIPNSASDLADPRLQRLLGGQLGDRPLDDLHRDPIPVRLQNESNTGATRSAALETVDLQAEVRLQLRPIGGGNLYPAPWGSVASYGLGEVHVLAFDPNRAPWKSERWADLSLLNLVGHAWDHGQISALPHAEQDPKDPRSYGVRQYLRKNHNQHRSLIGAAALLLAYGFMVGPWNFARARRQARPLGIFWRWLGLSVGASALVFGVGALARQLGKQATHLTFMEAAAGMPRASATRFRAFYAAALDDLQVHETSAGSVLGVVNSSDVVSAQLTLNGPLMSLGQFIAKPWQTLLVREDGFADLSAGISILGGRADGVEVVNRAGRDLTAVIVHDGEGKFAFFASIADGQRVAFSQGLSLPIAPSRTTTLRSALSLSQFEAWIDEIAPGAAQAWSAIEDLGVGDVEWWPNGVPTLIGQLSGGEGLEQDSGLTLSRDRVLVRVVGYGEAP